MSDFFLIRLYLWPCSSTRCSVKSEAKPKPPSGIYHNLTVQSSEALAIMLSLKGFHLISKTGRLCPDTCNCKQIAVYRVLNMDMLDFKSYVLRLFWGFFFYLKSCSLEFFKCLTLKTKFPW